MIQKICLILFLQVHLVRAVLLLAIIKTVHSTKSLNLTNDKFEIEFEIEFENEEGLKNPRQRRNCKIFIRLYFKIIDLRQFFYNSSSTQI